MELNTDEADEGMGVILFAMPELVPGTTEDDEEKDEAIFTGRFFFVPGTGAALALLLLVVIFVLQGVLLVPLVVSPSRDLASRLS